MLTIVLPAIDEIPEARIEFEHSLVSLSKWEEIYQKPFFNKESKSGEELVGYIVSMLLTENPPENFIDRFTPEHFEKFAAYINENRTATTIRRLENQKKSNEIITTELIYFWMLNFKIPFVPCQDWHLSRLMTLIEICGVKQTKPKKMGRAEQVAEMRRLNAERRAAMNSDG